MRKYFMRSLAFCLVAALCAGAVMAWRTWRVYQTAMGGFQHLRYLLESGETVEGAPADDVLSDNYLLSLFGDNPELVQRLKTVVDLGMATDANLKLGNVNVMVVTYRKDEANKVVDAAIHAARQRFRPIVMTSLAFILGVLPLAISSGAGANARHSIGTGVIGGMIFSTVIATFFIPSLFRWVSRRDERAERAANKETQA